MKRTREFTVQQAARRLSVTLKYVRDLLYEQRFAGAYKEGRIWHIPAKAVSQCVKRRKLQNG